MLSQGFSCGWDYELATDEEPFLTKGTLDRNSGTEFLSRKLIKASEYNISKLEI